MDNAAVFPSKGEMRKLIQSGGVSLNKEKVYEKLNISAYNDKTIYNKLIKNN